MKRLNTGFVPFFFFFWSQWPYQRKCSKIRAKWQKLHLKYVHVHTQPRQRKCGPIPNFPGPMLFLFKKKGQADSWLHIVKLLESWQRAQHFNSQAEQTTVYFFSYVASIFRGHQFSSTNNVSVSAKYSHSIMCFKANRMKVGICSSNVQTLKHFTSIVCDLCLKHDTKSS